MKASSLGKLSAKYALMHLIPASLYVPHALTIHALGLLSEYNWILAATKARLTKRRKK